MTVGVTARSRARKTAFADGAGCGASHAVREIDNTPAVTLQPGGEARGSAVLLCSRPDRLHAVWQIADLSHDRIVAVPWLIQCWSASG
jgi:hypothetical protein